MRSQRPWSMSGSGSDCRSRTARSRRSESHRSAAQSRRVLLTISDPSAQRPLAAACADDLLWRCEARSGINDARSGVEVALIQMLSLFLVIAGVFGAAGIALAAAAAHAAPGAGLDSAANIL